MYSPCIKVCIHDPVTGLCRGCGRTLQEIQDWVDLSEAEQLRIMAELPDRLREHRQEKCEAVFRPAVRPKFKKAFPPAS